MRNPRPGRVLRHACHRLGGVLTPGGDRPPRTRWSAHACVHGRVATFAAVACSPADFAVRRGALGLMHAYNCVGQGNSVRAVFIAPGSAVAAPACCGSRSSYHGKNRLRLLDCLVNAQLRRPDQSALTCVRMRMKLAPTLPTGPSARVSVVAGQNNTAEK